MPTIVGKNTSLFRRTDCRKCASIVEYTMIEVKKRISKDYTGGTDIDYYISCPCCSSDIFVDGH